MALPPAWEAAKGFFGTYRDYLRNSFGQILQKNYEIEVEQRQNTPEELEKDKLQESRMNGYKAIILFGLGGTFWTIASSAFADGHKRLSEIDSQLPMNLNIASFFMLYLFASMVIMLCGLIASTFHKSSVLSTCIAGLGAWKSILFVLTSVHVASLKFTDDCYKCFYSFTVSSTLVTIYWSMSAQDPKLFHIVAKLLVWIACVVGVMILLLTAAVIGLVTTGFVYGVSNLGDAVLKLQRHLLRRNAPAYDRV